MEGVTLRPFNPSLRGAVCGHYRAYKSTGGFAFASQAVIASVRWVAAAAGSAPDYPVQGPQFMVPLRITASVNVATAVTAQRQDPLDVIAARAYTASESTNVATFTLTGNNAKAQTSYSTSQFVTAGQMVVTNNAAGISGGTSTLDSQAFGFGPLTPALTALGSSTGAIDLYRADVHQSEDPMKFATNEGFQIRWGLTALGTGTVNVVIGIEWMEVVAY